MLRKALAVILWISSLSVGFHYVFSSFYPEGIDSGLIWEYLDWVMAISVSIALVVHYLRKLELDREGFDDSITREYVEINLALYASLLLALLFFWNWADDLVSGIELQGDNRLLIWSVLNPVFVMISGITGAHLWRAASR